MAVKNRYFIKQMTFKEEGTFQSFYAAGGWLKRNGYSYGSSAAGRAPNSPIAIRKGEYDLPQKWHNFSRVDKESVDGIMESNDWREGEVKVTLYK